LNTNKKSYSAKFVSQIQPSAMTGSGRNCLWYLPTSALDMATGFIIAKLNKCCFDCGLCMRSYRCVLHCIQYRYYRCVRYVVSCGCRPLTLPVNISVFPSSPSYGSSAINVTTQRNKLTYLLANAVFIYTAMQKKSNQFSFVCVCFST